MKSCEGRQGSNQSKRPCQQDQSQQYSEGFSEKCGQNANCEGNLRIGNGRFNTSFSKEQCHLVNVEVVRTVFLFKKSLFCFFPTVLYMKNEENEGKEMGEAGESKAACLPSVALGGQTLCLMKTTARTKLHKTFWLPAQNSARLFFILCQTPSIETVWDCHFDAHREQRIIQYGARGEDFFAP